MSLKWNSEWGDPPLHFSNSDTKTPGVVKELELYAAITHAAITGAYIFTLPYHIRRKNWLRVLLHCGLASYHIWAAREHQRDALR